ncbi:MAG: hypothetical protein E6P95_02445 [Candidatus Moraniibacteriota bacterium]|nr:MAG: hypothetical protein E6P95_02445 [Candidatus Moranbacteria bacterium]
MFDFLELLLNSVTWGILLLTLIFAVGIVWRVEAELDTAYKFFSFAVVFYFLNEIITKLPVVREWIWGDMLMTVVHFLSALFLFLGMYYMRDLVRRMDGEKK